MDKERRVICYPESDADKTIYLGQTMLLSEMWQYEDDAMAVTTTEHDPDYLEETTICIGALND